MMAAMDLAGANVAVTGAGGFIGRAVTERLRALGADVLAVDRDPAAAPAGPARFALVDVTDADAVRRALSGADVVVHTAALLGDRGTPADHLRVNVHGTRNVLDAAGGARVVHVSSVAAWGYDFPRDLADEDAPLRQCGARYIDTKAAAEALARRRGAVVVRPGDVYGPRSEPWIARPLRAMRTRQFVLPGRGAGVMTPVFVDDLVDCLLLAATHPGAEGMAFTAHDGRPLPARDFFAHHARWLGRRRVPTAPAPLLRVVAAVGERAARLAGREPEVSPEVIAYVSRRAAYPNARAREILGWSPATELETGMARSESWAREAGLLG